jgi:hypothetical protein
MKKIILWLSIALPLAASVQETLPSWHWSYEYIEDFQLVGLFQNLFQMSQPYTRGEVARSLIDIGRQIKTGQISFSRAEILRYKRLLFEFSPEIQSCQGRGDSLDVLELGGHLIEDMVQQSDRETELKGIYRSKIHVPIGEHIALYNGINFDQYRVDDPNYMGKKWRGIAGYTEQAYASFNLGRFRSKFGRDFLKWGAGFSGTLLFSNNARPMDHFIGSVDTGPFRFTYLFARLDDWLLTTDLRDSLGGPVARRYISSHRLNARFFDGRLQCAVTEVVVYGGVNRSPEWAYLNPFIFYHGAQLNENGLTNTFGSIDLTGYPVNHWQLWGSLLIDDIQIEKTGPGDLEPNEIGFLIGTQYGLGANTRLLFEYVRITNRTYKTSNPWETFIYRGQPLAYPLGNDFDYWTAGLTQWIGAAFRGRLTYSQIHHGEGSLYSPFDMPWMNFTVEEGYSEPFPTGIVENTVTLQIVLDYYASGLWGLRGEWAFTKFKNYQHLEHKTETRLFLKLGIWLDGSVLIRM